MSYTDFDFPNSDFYRSDLRQLIRNMKKLEEIMRSFVNAEEIKFADPIIWNITSQYAKSTVVLDTSGNAYLSKQPVPTGIQLNNEDYWQEIFNFADYVKTANKNLTVNYEANTTRATHAYRVDDWLIYNNVLYKVTRAIAVEDMLVINTNIVHFTVEDFIKAFMTWATNTIHQYKTDIDASELQYKNDIDASELQYKNDIDASEAAFTANLQHQFDLAIAGATVDSEVVLAREAYDGTSFATLRYAIIGQIENVLSHNYALVESIRAAHISTQYPITAPTSNTTSKYARAGFKAGHSYLIDFRCIQSKATSIGVTTVDDANNPVTVDNLGTFTQFIGTGTDVILYYVPAADVEWLRILISSAYQNPQSFELYVTDLTAKEVDESLFTLINYPITAPTSNTTNKYVRYDFEAGKDYLVKFNCTQSAATELVFGTTLTMEANNVDDLGVYTTGISTGDVVIIPFTATADASYLRIQIRSAYQTPQTFSVDIGRISNEFIEFNYSGDQANTVIGRMQDGANALSTDLSGNPNVGCNIAIGYNNMENNTGCKNLAIGNQNLKDNSGVANVAVGYHSGFRMTTGNSNVGVGDETNDDCTSGNNNVAVGSHAAQRNTSGSNNVAIGHNALKGSGSYNPSHVVNNNIAIGSGALSSQNTGDNNIVIGKDAQTISGLSNNIIIGHGINTVNNNDIIIGDASHTRVVIAGHILTFHNDGSITWA